MANKGGFIDYHFSFIGDGRTWDSTNRVVNVPSGSTLGTAEELATKIICNAASCLMDAGWKAETVKFADYQNIDTENYVPQNYTAAYWVESNHSTQQEPIYNYIYVFQDSSAKILEIPLRYTKVNGDITHIWLLYNYTWINGSTDYDNLPAHAGDLDYYLDTNKYFTWATKQSSYSLGLSILYLPPHTEITQAFKLIPVSGQHANSTISSNYMKTLPVLALQDKVYTYHFTCKDDTIFMSLRSSGWTSNSVPQFSTAMVGELLNDLLDSSDNTFSSRKYMALHSEVGFQSGASNESSYLANGFTKNDSLAFNGSTQPWMQWYDANGNIQVMCSSQYTSSAYPIGMGMFYTADWLLRSLNFASNECQYSKILIGNIPIRGTYQTGDARVSENHYIKGFIDESVMVAVGQTYFIATTYPNKFYICDTFDNGNYIYIGSGLCIGWDSGNDKKLNNDSSTDAMKPISSTNPIQS